MQLVVPGIRLAQVLPEQEFSGSGPNILQPPGFPSIDHNWRKQQANSHSVLLARVEAATLLARQSQKSVVVRSLGPLARGW